jgi:hypothetical protein
MLRTTDKGQRTKVIVSDEPNKLANDEPASVSHGVEPQAAPAPTAENGRAAGPPPSSASDAGVAPEPPEGSTSEDQADDFEIVPVSSAPLSRPRLAASEAEQAAAAKKAAEAAGDIEFKHYILKVQSNREK